MHQLKPLPSTKKAKKKNSRLAFLFASFIFIFIFLNCIYVNQLTQPHLSDFSLDDYAAVEDIDKENNFSPKTLPMKHHSLSPPSKIQQIDDLLQKKVEELKKISTPFYIYDDANITLANVSLRRASFYWDRFNQEMYNDNQMLAALKRSPLRTYDSDKAELFIATSPLGWLLTRKQEDKNMTHIQVVVNKTMTSLVTHPIFRKHHGKYHVLFSTNFMLFRKEKIPLYRIMNDFYHTLYHVTPILCWDPVAVYKDIHQLQNTKNNINGGAYGAHWNEYLQAYLESPPLVKSSVSVGLGGSNDSLNLTIASIQKFDSSSNFIFYHTRSHPPSRFNSTIYRHAPITNVTSVNFPKSSIGWEINKEKWSSEFVDSKFCLVIRGDSPHSHSLWRSIRVGCIPVIVSDNLPIFSPILKSTLNMCDYSVCIMENEFITDTEKALLKLNELSNDDIEAKIRHLAFAQRVIFTDHPQSLFTQALIKEVRIANGMFESDVEKKIMSVTNV